MHQLSDQLEQFEDVGLVRQLEADEGAFIFKHALTQESAYESLLLKKRQEIHRLVADAYEELFPSDLDENAPLLAEHYRQVGDNAKAVPVLSQAITALEQVHDEHEWILATGFRRLAMAMLGDYGGGVADAGRALARAIESNTLTGKAFAHGALGIIHFFSNAQSRGIDSARLSIETAAASGDRLYEYVAHSITGWAYARANDCDNAKQFAQAQSIAQEIGGQLLFSEWFAAASAERALRCGQAEHALALVSEVVAEAQPSKNLFAEGLAERIHGQALARLEPAQHDKADSHFANSFAKLEEGGARLEAARTRVAWGRARMERGDSKAAREMLEKAAAQFMVAGLTHELKEAQQLVDASHG